MKKQILISLISIGSILGVNAQQLFIPGNNGTNTGIGTSTSGQIGIGIQFAQQKLTVYDGNVLISSGTNTANGFIGKYCFSPGGGYFVDPSAYIGGVFEGGAWYNGSALVFATSPGPDITSGNYTVERMRINRYGNVGIGTTTPQDKLSVFSTASVGQSISSSGGSSYLTIKGKDNTQASFLSIETQLTPSTLNPDWGIGKLYNTNLSIWTNDGSSNIPKLVILPDGSVGIGTTDPQTKLHVNGDLRVDGEIFHRGTLKSKQIKVEMPNYEWKDIVFDKGYKLMELPEVERFISQNKHLPCIPSSSEVEKAGLDIGQFQASLLQKIEELTLYAIEQHKAIEELKQVVKAQNEKIETLTSVSK